LHLLLETARYSNLFKMDFFSNFHGEGLITGSFEISGDSYEKLSSKYIDEFGDLNIWNDS